MIDATLNALTKQTEKLLKLSVSDFNKDDYQMALLHGTIAAELMLKAKLWKINKGLVLDDLDGRRNEKNTVGLSFIPKRLKRCGHPLAEEEANLISILCEERNHIVHFIPNPNFQNLRARATDMFDFVASYFEREFKKDLRDKVPTVKGASFRAFKKAAAERIKLAKEAASKEGNIELRESCPSCGHKKTISKRDDYNAYCHFCKKQLRIVPCGLCDHPAYVNNLYDLQSPHDRCIASFEPDIEPYWK